MERTSWSRRHRPPSVRFREKVNTDGPVPDYAPHLGPCWLWTGYIDSGTGYGRFGVAQGNITTAHRFAYEQQHGPVPDGLHLDHLCRVRACCNPDHLEAVTHRENLLRGDTIAARSAAATRCPQGHPYDEQNTRYKPNGSRYCHACSLDRNRARYPTTRTPEKIAAANARRRERYAQRQT